MSQIKLDVQGMMCPHCVANVKKALEAVEGTANVEVSLEENSAVLEIAEGVDVNALIGAIIEAGYLASVA